MEKRIENTSLSVDAANIRILRDIRNSWLAALDVRLKNERLFELELYLKALDRFCNVRNHPISDMERILERDFKVETRLLVDILGRVIALSKSLLPEGKTSAYYFQQYVERRLINDRARMEMMEQSLKQNTPEESLYVLESAMTNLREISLALLGLKTISYTLFHYIGQMVSREIAWNTFFNPFHLGEFSPNHDRIRNAAILKIAKTGIPPILRRELSIIFLISFRLLHYLQYVHEEESEHWELLQNLPIFVLVKSEINVLIEFLENDLPKSIKAKGLDNNAKPLLDTFDSLAFQLNMESKKVYTLEIENAANEEDVNRLRTGMARGKGVIVEILRQVVVQLARVLDPSIEGRHIFRDFISRTSLSLKLRKDIWIFHKVVDNFEKSIRENIPKKEYKQVIEAFKSLRNYIFYFQNVSFQMVRFTDREAFTDFFMVVDSFVADNLYDPEKIEELHKSIHAFFIFLKTTLENLSQRAELRDKPFGMREGEYILEQFLK